MAAAYVKEYETRYYDELYMDDPTTIKWTDLSSCGTQRQVVPRAWIRENELANEAIRPLVAETDYCLIAFGVDGKELRTDVAKKEFRTPAFTPTEECTFDLDVTVSRQNLSIKVTPSNKNLTYICHLDKSATYYEFENDMQYAADDLFWTKYNLEAGRTLSDELLTGDIEMKAENLWASTRLCGLCLRLYGRRGDYHAAHIGPRIDRGRFGYASGHCRQAAFGAGTVASVSENKNPRLLASRGFLRMTTRAGHRLL